MTESPNKLPTNWLIKRLDEVSRIVAGATPKTGEPKYWDGEIFWATPKDLSGLDSKTLKDTARKITQAGLKSCAADILPPGSVLFSSRAPIGLTAINEMPVATNQGFKSFVPFKDKIAADYLYHWLRCNRAYLDSLGNGATFKEVSKAVVSRIEIPLPPLAEQKRIAAILDKADAIRRKLQQSLRLSDDFLRSVFLDMFGDPVTNPKGWPILELQELGKISTGTTPPSKLENMFDGSIPFVTPGDLKEGWISTKRTVTEQGAKQSRTVRKGATLVCCIGATIGKMGKAAQVSAFNQQINAVEWNRQVNDYFGIEVLKFFKARIADQGMSTTLPILNKSSFQRLTIPVPPISDQCKFAGIIESTERNASRLNSQLVESESLFSSLQQRAFRGEL